MLTTVYAREDDMTFIMKTTMTEESEKIECVGWYYGVPDEEKTKEFEGNLMAEFPRRWR